MICFETLWHLKFSNNFLMGNFEIKSVCRRYALISPPQPTNPISLPHPHPPHPATTSPRTPYRYCTPTHPIPLPTPTTPSRYHIPTLHPATPPPPTPSCYRHHLLKKHSFYQSLLTVCLRELLHDFFYIFIICRYHTSRRVSERPSLVGCSARM